MALSKIPFCPIIGNHQKAYSSYFSTGDRTLQRETVQGLSINQSINQSCIIMISMVSEGLSAADRVKNVTTTPEAATLILSLLENALVVEG